MGIFLRASHDTNLLTSGILCCVCQPAKEIWTIGIVPRHWRLPQSARAAGAFGSELEVASDLHGSGAFGAELDDLHGKNARFSSVMASDCGGPSQFCQFLVAGIKSTLCSKLLAPFKPATSNGSQKCQSVKLWLCGRG